LSVGGNSPEQAVNEKDPKKLLELTAEINQLWEAKEQRILKQLQTENEKQSAA